MNKPTLIAAEPVSAYDAKTHRGDIASVHRAIGKVAVIRGNLARKGVTLAAVLADKETARGLAHAGHRY